MTEQLKTGSLGAFRRLLSAWETASPATDRYELVAKALSSVHGVDKNPFAAAIARFRLMLAAMRAAGVERLTDKVDFRINIAVGDSLLHGKGAPGRQGEFDFGGLEASTHTYRTEDVDDYIKSCHILEYGSYHVVVANPPYITVKDEKENGNYRKAYESCSGKYALSVPFAERIFQLAIRDVGYTGQITSNSFMKREFGKALIENFFPKVDLTIVIDTSGAYIPGHGTPTVILIGRRRFPRSNSSIRAALGVRGEPGQPSNPAKGFVWQAITSQIDEPGSESEWVSVADLSREHFSTHPWSLSGGGAADVSEIINQQPRRLTDLISDIGMTILTLEDEAYVMPIAAASRLGFSEICTRLVIGDEVRDYVFLPGESVLMPQEIDGERRELGTAAERYLWMYRTGLARRLYFGQVPEQRGMRWFDLGMFFPKRHRTPLSIAFVEVATHNHFVLDRGGKVFKQTAPVIKLPDGVSESDHLALLGVLNSSTTCFWLKQVCHCKGSTVDTKGARQTTVPWEDFYQFNSMKVRELPLPSTLPSGYGRDIDHLAQQLAATTTREEDNRLRTRMIALQEELDWDVYHRYGLLILHLLFLAL